MDNLSDEFYNGLTVVETFRDFKIMQNHKGLYGLIFHDELIEECKYCEITRMDSYFLCRRLGYLQYVNFDGEVSFIQEFHETESESETKEGQIIVCKKGKYGMLDSNRKLILPIEYDKLWKWNECDVIYTRKGTTVKYYDTEGNEILSRVRKIESANDKYQPYYIGEPQTNVIQLMDLTDNPTGDDYCRCFGRKAALSRRLCYEHFDYLQSHANVKSFDISARDAFLAQDCYIYAAFAVQSAQNSQSPLVDCIHQLQSIYQFESSWEWIYLVLYPEDAEINIERDRWVFSCVDMDCSGNSTKGIAFGRSNDVKYGVKLIATRFFRDHWPSDEEFEEGSWGLHQNVFGLKQLICRNPDKRHKILEKAMRNTLKSVPFKYKWKPIKNKLQWLKSQNAPITPDSIWNLIDIICVFKNDIKNITNAIIWLVENGADINHISSGYSALDMLQRYKQDREIRIDNILRFLIAHGAKGYEEIRRTDSLNHGFETMVSFKQYDFQPMYF